MSERNTVIRSMHDLGVTAWFGGGLMGAVGLNGATAKAHDPDERLGLSSIGWAPVQLGAIIVHGVGGLALISANKSRLLAQGEARSNTAVKTVLTGLAGGATLYAAVLGARIAKHADEGAKGVSEPGPSSSGALASALRQQKVVQWLIPLFTSSLIVLGAQQGEQQRPVAGLVERAKKSVAGR